MAPPSPGGSTARKIASVSPSPPIRGEGGLVPRIRSAGAVPLRPQAQDLAGNSSSITSKSLQRVVSGDDPNRVSPQRGDDRMKGLKIRPYADPHCTPATRGRRGASAGETKPGIARSYNVRQTRFTSPPDNPIFLVRWRSRNRRRGILARARATQYIEMDCRPRCFYLASATSVSNRFCRAFRNGQLCDFRRFPATCKQHKTYSRRECRQRHDQLAPS